MNKKRGDSMENNSQKFSHESKNNDGVKEIPKKADYLFEVSWEVCNKVGGIYTVVKSKVSFMLEHYKENYFAIGPYFPNKAAGEFDEKLPLPKLKKIFETLDSEGIKCHYGRWLAKGEPNTVLIDFEQYVKNKNEIKGKLWDDYKIDSLGTEYHDYDEPVVWATAVGRFIEEFAKNSENEKIVAHFHEWLAGAGLLYLKSRKANVATVFTTHATMLGRTLASAENLYELIGRVDPDKEAYNHKVHTKYQTERACAQNADVFATVSGITAIETEALLKKKPDLLLPNGLDLDKFPTFEEISIKHKLFKRKIKEFLIYFFFPHYSFDLEETLIYFISGRYEFHDKGIDIFIKALSKLNERLKKEDFKKTIVAFFWIPGNVRSIKQELLENRTLYQDLRESINDNIEDIKNSVIYLLASHRNIKRQTLFDKDLYYEIKLKTFKLIKKGKALISTHDLYNEEEDQIIKALKEAKLENSVEDKVKVVFYPMYLTGADQLLDLNYYESMLGSHLGVFASYYEPWGYTPLEAAALGVASVTTDLAGFGMFVKEIKREDDNYPGIFVLERLESTDEETVKKLAGVLYDYSKLNREERIKNKIEAVRLSKFADWKIFTKNYIEAHNLAIERRFGK